MRKELTDSLYQRYPAIFAIHSREQGEETYEPIWCKDGWFDLIDTLCEQLQYWAEVRHTPPPVAISVKEKFGAMRFVAQDVNAEQSGAIKLASALSTRLCEVCGAPGHLVVDGGCWMTRCAQHAPEGAISVEELEHRLAMRDKNRDEAK